MPAKTDTLASAAAASAAEKNCKGGADLENEETDPVSNANRELAVLAERCFSEGSFADSLSHLTKLQEQRPLDTRFAHNSAVVEFYINELRNVGEFSKKLNSVCSLVSILRVIVTEQIAPSFAIHYPHGCDEWMRGDFVSQGDFNLDNIESLDDVRNCYVYFNEATLLYHSMQYSSALRIANKVFTFAELMGKKLTKSTKKWGGQRLRNV